MKTTNPTFHRVRKLKVVGGFLDGIDVNIADGLNCLIGPRGTGKSTILELMRYALDTLPGKPGDSLRRRAESLVEFNLQGGRVELLVETKDGLAYTITRAWDEDTIVLDESGNSVPMKVRGAVLFQADFFSQNEMETIAETPHYQLALLDKFEQSSLAELNWKLDETVQKIDANKGRLIPLLTKRDQLELQVKELPGLEEKLKAYVTGKGEEADKINTAHSHKALRDREAKALELSLAAIKERHNEAKALKGALAQDIQETIDDEVLAGPNKTLMSRAVRELSAATADSDAKINEAMVTLVTAYKQVQAVQKELKTLHDTQEIEFRKLLETQKANQAKSAERSKLEKLRNDLLFKKKDLTEVQKQIKALMESREQMLDELSERRDQRSRLRQDVAKSLNKALMPQIKVQVLQYGDRTEYRDYLLKSLRGENIKQGEPSKLISSRISPSEFGELVKAGDANGLMQKTGINSNQAQAVLRAFTAERLFELEVIDMDDLPSIQLNDGGDYKDSGSLSTGQKCTAILPILLFDSANPLLVDQPEDNLDNSFVFETIVKSVLRAKVSRQLIFVTHNPNIPVLGEANQVIVMKSDGRSARPIKVGNVDECKDEIVTLLEGGEEAFNKRKERYHY